MKEILITMKVYLPVFIMAILSFTAKAQDTVKIIIPKSLIPIEVLCGNNRMYHQTSINRKITKNNKLGIFNISSFTANYKNEIYKNEFVSTTALYYDLYKGIGVNAGASFSAAEGIKPYFGLQYMYVKKAISVIYLPGYYYLQDRSISNFALFEYKPTLSRKWSIYSRFQGKYNYNIETSGHARSYLYSRLGLTYSNCSFGVGSNSDWYGLKKLHKVNYGLFLRINI